MTRGARLITILAIPVAVFTFSTTCPSAPLMVEKNLFAQDRKPPSGESSPTTPQGNTPSLPPKAFQLDGVFMFGEIKKALIRVKGQLPGKDKGKNASPYEVVSEGMRIGDYQVVKIENRSISLEKDGQTYVVSLFAEGKVVPPPPPMPASHAGAQPPPGIPESPNAPGANRPRGMPQQPGRPPGMDPRGAPTPQMAGPQHRDDQSGQPQDINVPEDMESDEELMDDEDVVDDAN